MLKLWVRIASAFKMYEKWAVSYKVKTDTEEFVGHYLFELRPFMAGGNILDIMNFLKKKHDAKHAVIIGMARVERGFKKVGEW